MHNTEHIAVKSRRQRAQLKKYYKFIQQHRETDTHTHTHTHTCA